MKFLLDTDVVIALMRRHAAVLARLTSYLPEDFGIPSIVAHELFYGAFKGLRVDDNLARIETMMFEIVDFDREDARKSGELRARLAREGSPIGPYDVLVAGQALARDLIVVTHNTREFQRVAGLRVEDWE